MTDHLEWKRLVPISETFADARLQVHWAAQVIAAAGAAHVAARPDDSHRNLEWLPELGVFAGNAATEDPSFRLALSPYTVELFLLDDEGEEDLSIGLGGESLDSALRWAESAISDYTGRAVRTLERPEYELPDHPVAHSGEFMAADADLNAVQAWYANAYLALSELTDSIEGAAPVRCWPHHFDIATLITLPGSDGKSVGVGMTPGDGSYADPYWYVSPWPYPETRDLPELAAGHWHTEGWIGAVLEADELVAASDQHELLTSFLQNAVAVSRSLLD